MTQAVCDSTSDNVTIAVRKVFAGDEALWQPNMSNLLMTADYAKSERIKRCAASQSVYLPSCT